MMNFDAVAAPFDPDFDADNPYIHDVPERFVVEDDGFEEAFGAWAEDTYDPDAEAYYADATHAQWG